MFRLLIVQTSSYPKQIIMLLPNVPHYTTSSMCESKYETTSFYFTASQPLLSGSPTGSFLYFKKYIIAKWSV